jgi:XTP/dITP diphosphohydrolase
MIDSVDGTCEGEIGYAPRGEHGFGYDPVFLVEGYGGQTLAEIDPEEKNRISHRARAVRAAHPLLVQLLQDAQGPLE